MRLVNKENPFIEYEVELDDETGEYVDNSMRRFTVMGDTVYMMFDGMILMGDEYEFTL